MRLWAAVLVPFLYISAQAQAPLFQTQAPLDLRIQADLHALLRDRGEKRVEHPGTLRFQDGADTGTVKVNLRTRGIFRLKTCAFPPIRIDLPGKKVEHTRLRAGQTQARHCLSAGSYSAITCVSIPCTAFNALTGTSFRVRLAHVTYIDSAHRYGPVRVPHRIGRGVGPPRRCGEFRPTTCTNS
jgi:hypothetical protein